MRKGGREDVHVAEGRTRTGFQKFFRHTLYTITTTHQPLLPHSGRKEDGGRLKRKEGTGTIKVTQKLAEMIKYCTDYSILSRQVN